MWFVLVWSTVIWCVLHMRFGEAWCNLVWFGVAWCNLAGFGWQLYQKWCPGFVVRYCITYKNIGPWRYLCFPKVNMVNRDHFFCCKHNLFLCYMLVITKQKQTSHECSLLRRFLVRSYELSVSLDFVDWLEEILKNKLQLLQPT